MSGNVVGVVGTGAMGSGIAQVAAIAGRNVVAVDVSTSALEKAQASIRQSLSRMVKKESISQEDADSAFSRVSFSTKYEALSPADVIIEAATETLELKRKILRDISRVAAEGALIATNTSSLSVTALANEVQRPETFVGIHFFNPVPMMP